MLIKPKPLQPKINMGLFKRILLNVLIEMRKHSNAFDIQKVIKLQNRLNNDPESVLDDMLSMWRNLKDRVIKLERIMTW